MGKHEVGITQLTVPADISANLSVEKSIISINKLLFFTLRSLFATIIPFLYCQKALTSHADLNTAATAQHRLRVAHDTSARALPTDAIDEHLIITMQRIN